jgi:DNA-binding NarL/FixJ family response regulator
MAKGGPFVSGGDHRTAVVCDRHPLWIEAIESVLGRAEIEVVGRSTTAEAGFEAVSRHRPSLLVTDAFIEGTDEADGVGLVERARAKLPDLRAIVVSLSDQRSTIDRAFQAGASAYVMKSAHGDDLASAARQAFDHSLFLAGGPRLVTSTMPDHDDPVEKADLTRREREILRLAAEGHSNAQLARMLWVTEQTVKFHLSNVYRKLDVANRTEAGRWAQLNGLLPEKALDAA